jgi:uncharacterized protein (DUF2249 family)
MTDAAALSDALRRSNRLLIAALRALAEAGEGERACRLAAEAWSAIRTAAPDEAERLNQALHYLTRHATHGKGETSMSDLHQLDVRELPPRQRHALIFDTCDKLATGDALVLVNDHDPRPLYYQFEAEQPDRFGWEYLERGPEVWRVRITRQAA